MHRYHCHILTVPGQTHQHCSVAGVRPTSPSLVGQPRNVTWVFIFSKETASFEVTPRQDNQLIPIFLRFWLILALQVHILETLRSWENWDIWSFYTQGSVGASHLHSSMRLAYKVSCIIGVCYIIGLSAGTAHGHQPWNTPKLSRRHCFSWPSLGVSFLCPICPHTLLVFCMGSSRP